MKVKRSKLTIRIPKKWAQEMRAKEEKEIAFGRLLDMESSMESNPSINTALSSYDLACRFDLPVEDWRTSTLIGMYATLYKEYFGYLPNTAQGTLRTDYVAIKRLRYVHEAPNLVGAIRLLFTSPDMEWCKTKPLTMIAKQENLEKHLLPLVVAARKSRKSGEWIEWQGEVPKTGYIAKLVN